MASGLRSAVPHNAVHLCIDMQGIFVEATQWQTPWAARVLPTIIRLCEHRPERICFTRFIPAHRAGEGRGTWRSYWQRWEGMTLENIDAELVDLTPPLRAFVPPARVLDKSVYSPWIGTGLDQALSEGQVDTLIISGAETDVCVLAAVLGAVDLGYRVIVAVDGLCSSTDATHDSLIDLYETRYGQQVETAQTDEIIEAWQS